MDWKTQAPPNPKSTPGEWISAWEAEFSAFFEYPTKIHIRRIEAGTAKELGQVDIYRSKGSMINFYSYEIVEIHVTTDRGKVIYKFHVESLPALCGTMLVTYLGFTKDDIFTFRRRRGTTPLLIELIKQYARFRDYRNILGTAIVPQGEYDYTEDPTEQQVEKLKALGRWSYFKLKLNLLRSGFNVINEYVNVRSGNKINIFNINL